MRGIECALWGVLGRDPELKTSKTGNPFATMNVVVTVGTADDGKDISQWLRVACFGDAAEKIAAKARKGDRISCEGNLTLTSWADKATGEAKTGLNVAAWKCEKVASIGKSRAYQANGNSTGNSYAKPKQAAQSRHEGSGDLNDPLPW